MKTRTALLVAALTLAASGVDASVAGAIVRGTNPNYNLVGACNMVNPNAQPGMLGNPVQSGPGFNGMINAIFITSGISGGNCPGLPDG
jgi:hypothetical protein